MALAVPLWAAMCAGGTAAAAAVLALSPTRSPARRAEAMVEDEAPQPPAARPEGKTEGWWVIDARRSRQNSDPHARAVQLG